MLAITLHFPLECQRLQRRGSQHYEDDNASLCGHCSTHLPHLGLLPGGLGWVYPLARILNSSTWHGLPSVHVTTPTASPATVP